MPEAPETIDLSGGGGPWPAFTISGATGTDASAINATFLRKGYNWEIGSALIEGVGEEAWEINVGGNARFQGEGPWPWNSVWTPEVGSGGTLVFVRALAPPSSVSMAGAEAAVQATLAAGFSGTNNDIDFTAVPPGRLGNDIGITFTAVGTNAVLSVAVNGREIVINIGTGINAGTTTAAMVIAAIEESAAASALVTVEVAAGNNGTGQVTTRARATLSGGTGGLPLPPETVAI